MYKVILVEDEEIIRKGLKFSTDWFSLGTVVIGEASNGKEGLDLILKQQPDIVITDVNMPFLNGIEMLQEASLKHSFKSIVISGYDEYDYVRKALQLGSVDYLLKPFSQEELRTAINSAIEKIKQMKLLDISTKIKDVKLNLMSSSADPLVNKMLCYVATNYQNKVRLADVSQELNYSITSLKRRFKNSINMTFNEYLNAYRIQKAIEFGKEDLYTIQEISDKCGFSDYKYFSVVFKKYTGYNVLRFLEHLKTD